MAAPLAAFRKAELRLARADQLQIDLGQDLGIEQRAMLGAARIVDAIARAQIVEPVRPRRVLAAGQQQRIDQPFARDRRPLHALELGNQEAVIEAGIVDHQRRVADENQEIVDDVGKARLVLQERRRQPVDGEGFRRHLALRVEIAVEGRAGRDPVEQLDAAELDQAMALVGSRPVVSVSSTISRIGPPFSCCYHPRKRVNQ